MGRFMHVPVAALFWALGSVASAADFDGSKPLICAPVEAIGCSAGEPCDKGIPAEFGAPAFIRIDFAKKTIVGPKRTSPIRFMSNSGNKLLLQGTELSYGWTIALDAEGRMASTLVDGADVFVLFGSCTPL